MTSVAYRGARITMICNFAVLLCLLFAAYGCGSGPVLRAADANTRPAGANGSEAAPEAKANETVTVRNNMENVTNTNPVLEPAGDIGFEAKATQGEEGITIAYEVTNTWDADIYVLDAYPAVSQPNNTPYADFAGFYLCYRDPATALVVKGIPPLPSMPVSQRVMPLATRLPPKEKVAREFKLPLPLRERSDWYYQPLPPEAYSMSSVEKVAFHVQFIRSRVDGFRAEPSPYSADLFTVRSTNTVKQAETLRTEFSIGKTQLFMRKDLFPRL